jgi:hypothetical protein
MKNNLNVVITASPTPSHPSSFHIDSTIDSLRKINLPSATKIILAHDADSKDRLSEGYSIYLSRIKKKYSVSNNFHFTILDKKKNLTGNIKNASSLVDSKYTLIVQHDLPFVREFDVQKILLDLDNLTQIKHLRFNQRKNEEVGCDKVTKHLDYNLFGHILNGEHYSYISTPCWSDNNFICRTSHFFNEVLNECNENTAMEVIIFNKLLKVYSQNDAQKTIDIHKYYGTYIFGGLNDDPYIYHTNAYPKR